MVDDILQPDEKNALIIDKIDRYLLGRIKPKDAQKEEIEHINGFEEFCHSLQKHSPGKVVKQMTVHEFYSLVRFIKRQNDPVNGSKSNKVQRPSSR